MADLDRARRQAAHERPPRGVTKADWLATYPTYLDYEAADEQHFGPDPRRG